MTTPEVDVKKAIHIAIDYLREFQEFVPAEGIRLEETEHDDSGDWLITLSTIDPADLLRVQSRTYLEGIPEDNLTKAVSLGLLGGVKRIYKIFRIDAQTGNVKSMKVRTLQPIE
jgi:hypothetical protein